MYAKKKKNKISNADSVGIFHRLWLYLYVQNLKMIFCWKFFVGFLLWVSFIVFNAWYLWATHRQPFPFHWVILINLFVYGTYPRNKRVKESPMAITLQKGNVYEPEPLISKYIHSTEIMEGWTPYEFPSLNFFFLW